MLSSSTSSGFIRVFFFPNDYYYSLSAVKECRYTYDYFRRWYTSICISIIIKPREEGKKKVVFYHSPLEETIYNIYIVSSSITYGQLLNMKRTIHIYIYKVIAVFFLFFRYNKQISPKKERKEKKKTGLEKKKKDYKGLLKVIVFWNEWEKLLSWLYMREKMDTWILCLNSGSLFILMTTSTWWWSIIWFIPNIEKRRRID